MYFSLLFTNCFALSILRSCSFSLSPYLSLSQIFSISYIQQNMIILTSFLQFPLYSPQHSLHSNSSLCCYEYFIFNTPLSPVSAVQMCMGIELPSKAWDPSGGHILKIKCFSFPQQLTGNSSRVKKGSRGLPHLWENFGCLEFLHFLCQVPLPAVNSWLEFPLHVHKTVFHSILPILFQYIPWALIWYGEFNIDIPFSNEHSVSSSRHFDHTFVSALLHKAEETSLTKMESTSGVWA